jgi:hypothetical protein
MGQVLEKYDWRNIQNKTKKRCMPLCHSSKSFILKVVSIIRSRIKGEEEIGIVASWGQKKKRQYEGEVHEEQKAFEP